MLILLSGDYVLQSLVSKCLDDIHSVEFTIGIQYPDLDVVFGNRKESPRDIFEIL
jgi:hypothetical protein